MKTKIKNWLSPLLNREEKDNLKILATIGLWSLPLVPVVIAVIFPHWIFWCILVNVWMIWSALFFQFTKLISLKKINMVNNRNLELMSKADNSIFTSLESKLSTLDSKLGALTNQVSSLKIELEYVASATESNNSDISQLPNQIRLLTDQINNTLTDIMRLMDEK